MLTAEHVIRAHGQEGLLIGHPVDEKSAAVPQQAQSALEDAEELTRWRR